MGWGAVALAREAVCGVCSAFALWPGEPPFAPTKIFGMWMQLMFSAKHQKQLEKLAVVLLPANCAHRRDAGEGGSSN
jgi:hypothetical protein